jgi:membrane-bound lytic murein transglycosylase F
VLSFSASEPVDDWHKGELVVILPPADSLDLEFNRQLVELFSAQLKVKLKTIELFPYQIGNALAMHEAHFSAIGMRVSSDDASFRFGVPYQTLSEWVVCGGAQPRGVADLSGRELVVVTGSAEESALREAQHSFRDLRWTSENKSKPNELLEEVASGETDCTVANEEQISFMRNFHPGMEGAFEITSPSQLAWTFGADADPDLYAQMEKFFEKIDDDGTLDRLIDQYYGHSDRIMPIDAAAFLAKTSTVLPRYRHIFEEASSLTGIEWQLLAAMAYRESQWNPLATSYTKVRGMMMLTEETADRMHVSNRLDARESIMAGARYLQLLKEQLPLRIDEPERTWLALAAYNQGMAHLEDARILTQRYGQNPDLWVDVQKSMVKLRNPNVANTLKHGYARGGEAVVFVETVRLYYDMLTRISREEYKQLLPPDYQIRLNAW